MPQTLTSYTSSSTRQPLRRTTLHHSTAIPDRRRETTGLAAALASSQHETVSASLEKKLATVLRDGEEMPDLRLLFRLMGRLVKKSQDDLVGADGQRWVAEQRLLCSRLDSREAHQELHRRMVRLRRALVEHYGADFCRTCFAWDERTPRGALDLAVAARTLVVRLRDPDLALPSLDLPGITVDPTAWADELEPPLARLEELLDDIDLRRIAASDMGIGRQRALAEHDETYLAVAQTAEALFRLAGEMFLRERLRPKARRKVRPKARGDARRMAAAGREKKGGLAKLLPWPRKPWNFARTAVWRVAMGLTAAGIA